MRSILDDLRHAIRSLAKSPGFTSLAILCLALGIGANSTIFSIVDGLSLRPLPVDRPDEVIYVGSTRSSFMSYPDYLDLRDNARSLAGLIATARYGPVLGRGEQAEPTQTIAATGNYFTVLGIKPALGRVFTEQDRESAEPVLVMSYGLWQRRFGGDPGLVGRQVLLGGESYTVLGIAPRGFRGLRLDLETDLWLPLSGRWEPSTDRRDRGLDLIGRLRPGVSLAQARVELEGIARNLERAYPATNRQFGVRVWNQRSQIGPAPYLLLGIAGLVLLIACANVANLLLARAEGRRREIAVRAAMGAGRARLVRQLLAESALLAAAATLAALALAWWMIEAAPSLVVTPSPRGTGYQFLFDGRMLAFTLLASLATVFLFGLVPALSAARMDLAPVLKGESAAAAGGRVRPRDALVVLQVALSLVALTFAGLLLRSFAASARLDLGFQRRDLLLVQIDTRYKLPQSRVFFAGLTEKVRAIPGVRQVTLATRPPMWLSGGGMFATVSVPGYAATDGESVFRIKDLVIGLDYFPALGIRLLQGRDFNDRDTDAGAKVAIVNETMARRFWPRESPLGKIVRVQAGAAQADREIVGVVQDTRINNPYEPPEPYLYLPFAQSTARAMTLIVSTDGDPLDWAGAVKAQIASLDETVRPYEIWTMRRLIRFHFFDLERPATTVSALGLLGLILAAIGLYGVVSWSVTRRTREVGIRLALGATAWHALSLVIWHGLKVTLFGIALGVSAVLLFTPLLRHLVSDIDPSDPLTLAGVAVLLLLVALAASWLPGRRATRIDPLAALRYE